MVGGACEEKCKLLNGTETESEKGNDGTNSDENPVKECGTMKERRNESKGKIESYSKKKTLSPRK